MCLIGWGSVAVVPASSPASAFSGLGGPWVGVAVRVVVGEQLGLRSQGGKRAVDVRVRAAAPPLIYAVGACMEGSVGKGVWRLV